MVGKFALYLCPEQGCAVVGKGPGNCPTHGKEFERTVVWTDTAMRKRLRFVVEQTKARSGSFEDLFKGLGLK